MTLDQRYLYLKIFAGNLAVLRYTIHNSLGDGKMNRSIAAFMGTLVVLMPALVQAAAFLVSDP